MKGICPNCEEARELKKVNKEETIRVRDEDISVDCAFLVCNSCKTEFEDPKAKANPVEEAYRIYRAKHAMLQPDEIKAFRNKYGLTQHELCLLLGWGLATINRYENGALQDDCHEKSLRLATNPSNLLELIRETPDALSDKKKKDLIEELQSELEESHSFKKMYEERFGKYKPDIFNGFRSLNISKLFNVIIFFCSDGVLKTKLNKLLFYADFFHFKRQSVSITGANYVHLPHGPVPDNYEHYFATLIHEEGALLVEEIEFSKDIIGEKFVSRVHPDLSVFEESELETLIEVKKRFKNMSSTQIRNLSHNEGAYANTASGEYISYEYAEDIE